MDKQLRVPRVLNARKVGKIAPNAVYVGRPSPYGNPFVLGVHGTREEVIAMHEARVRGDRRLRQDIRRDLKGKDLICWCAPETCHADIYLRIANGLEIPEDIL